MARYLGIDLGTTKIAAVVIDAATGRVIASASAPNDARTPAPNGRSEWDAREIVATALRTAHAALVAARKTSATPGVVDHAVDVAAIGVTGQMHGIVLVGGDLAPLSPFVNWQDKRCDEPTDRAESTISAMLALADPSRLARTGCRLATGFAGPTLYWLGRHGLLPARATAAFLPDYLVAVLAGQRPVTDPTDAGGSGLFDLVARDWDPALLGSLGLPRAVFPEVRPTGAVVGRLASGPAAALGLPTGTPVLNGLGDNQASFVGSVAKPATDLLLNVGTGAQVSAVASTLAPAGELETRAFLGNAYLLAGNELAGGSAYAALRDFCRLVAGEVFGLSQAEVASEDIYGALNRLAAVVPPGCDGLSCDTRFAGSRVEPTRRGNLLALGFDSFTPGHFARAILEGLAERFAALYSEMLSAGLAPRARLVGSGNGVKRNPLLAAILADRFGLPLVTPTFAEEASYGAALLAARGTGELTSLDEIGDRIDYTTAIS